MKGTIVLYNEFEKRVSMRLYDSKTHRNYTLKYWEKFFGERFRRFSYHIIPHPTRKKIDQITPNTNLCTPK